MGTMFYNKFEWFSFCLCIAGEVKRQFLTTPKELMKKWIAEKLGNHAKTKSRRAARRAARSQRK